MDDDVNRLFEDAHGNIWLAMTKGITKIEYSSPLRVYNRQSSGLRGLVLSVTRHRGTLYAGTSIGLYRMNSSGKFEPFTGIASQCWALLSTGNALFAATTLGIFRAEESAGNAQKITGAPAYSLTRSAIEPNRIYAGSGGLISLTRQTSGKNREMESNVSDFNIPVYSVAEDSDGGLWLRIVTTLPQRAFAASTDRRVVASSMTSSW